MLMKHLMPQAVVVAPVNKDAQDVLRSSLPFGAWKRLLIRSVTIMTMAKENSLQVRKILMVIGTVPTKLCASLIDNAVKL